MNKPPARAPGHDVERLSTGKTDESLERGLADSAAGNVQDLGDFTQYADPMDEQAERLAQQHREQMAQQYNPDVHAAADSYARLTERVLEDQRRAQQAQLNQAAQRRGR